MLNTRTAEEEIKVRAEVEEDKGREQEDDDEDEGEGGEGGEEALLPILVPPQSFCLSLPEGEARSRRRESRHVWSVK